MNVEEYLAEAQRRRESVRPAGVPLEFEYPLGEISVGDHVRHWAKTDPDSLATGLRWVTLLAIPATVGLVLLRTPLVTLLYQRGSFTAASTQLVSWALLWYAVVSWLLAITSSL